ncbi:MAG: hypothetical protein M1823_002216 [Watsoniomyces obsoletus]|nr:MAG: hypothetical protein M1823_002216 [Watsoniomyces obsoletus]
MERLSINDNPPSGPIGAPEHNAPSTSSNAPAELQPPPAQLPVQMFTTAAQLLDLTDTNLMLQDTVERIFVQEVYADIPRGVFLVRGENVLLLGEIDLDKEDDIPEPYREAAPEVVMRLYKKEQEDRGRKEKSKRRKLQDLGFEGESAGDMVL